jgi:hypothetical protein
VSRTRFVITPDARGRTGSALQGAYGNDLPAPEWRLILMPVFCSVAPQHLARNPALAATRAATRAASLPVNWNTEAGWRLKIIKRGQRAFKIARLTWIVERTFAWLGRNRRLSKDYEYRVQTSETMLEIAATRLMLNRIAPP